MTLDRDIFQELPIFEPDILGSDESEGGEEEDYKLTEEYQPEKNESLLQEWIHEKWTDLLVRMFDAARTHKWCVVQLYNAPPYWRVFTYRQVHEIKYNENDEPISAKVMWAKTLPRATTFIYHEENLNFLSEKAEDLDEKGNALGKALMINFGNDLDEKIEGTDIENIWSLAIYMRYIVLDIINNSAKSSGFYWIKWGSQVDNDKKAEVATLMESANSSHAIGATENIIQDMQAMFMQHPEFPVEALDKILKIFSGACDMPLLYFNGEKEGGSIFEENSGAMAQVNRKMRKIFGNFKRYILQLVEMRWGIKCDDVFPNIEELEEEQYEEDIIEPRKENPKTDGGNGAASKLSSNKIKVKSK